MGSPRKAKSSRSTDRRLAVLFVALALATISACSSSTAGATTTPSPTASIPVSLIPTSADVCPSVPVPGCTELGDPLGAPKSCHVTVNAQFSIPRSPDAKLPSYGAGGGPVYVSGQLTWYVGSQGAVFLVDVAYAGAVRITGQLAEDATVVPTFTGADISDSGIDIPAGSDRPYWRFWDGQMSFAKPGCYTFSFAGTPEEPVTIYVHPGSPPGP